MYRDICIKLKEASEDGHLRTVIAYRMAMSDENSASSLFAGQTHSCVVDAKSGCQISDDCIKLIVWFDNEHGFAHRIVDLITQTHAAYCSKSD